MLLVLLAAVVATSEDAPYVEIVPHRHTFLGLPEVAGWGAVPARCCVVQASIETRENEKTGNSSSAEYTIILFSDGGMLLATADGEATRGFQKVAVTGGTVAPGSRLLFDQDAAVLPTAVAGPTGITAIQCSLSPGGGGETVSMTCTLDPARSTTAEFGAVTAVAAVGGARGPVFVAAAQGLFRCEGLDHAAVSSRPACTRLLGGDPTERPMTAVAAVHTPGSDAGAAASDKVVVAAGSGDKVWLLAATGRVVRWEWATVISGPNQGAGGVIDGPVTALAFDDGTDDIFAGNDLAINIRRAAANGSWTRTSGDAGLPFANVTALLPSVTDPVSGASQLWVGTARGLAVWSSDPAADPPWRYLYGPRWHPGRRVTAMAADVHTVFAATDGGLVWLEQQTWTLERKAKHMQAALARHDRHGLVAGCALPSFGNISRTHCVDDDNNGLWTSLVAAAEFFRFAVTKDPAAATSASHFLGGMQLLHRITGVPGLYARSACAPEDKGCAPDRASQVRGCDGDVTPGCCVTPGHAACGLQWRNSTVAGFEGWVWKSDTSSDETCGHFFAFSIAAKLAPSPAARAAAAETVAMMVDYMLENDYSLKDWTGYSTTWGRWAPRYVNFWRPFSDERGLQSLQILAFINAATSVSSALPDTPSRTARRVRWAAAYAALTNATNDYSANMLNAKIEAPVDDNFSDDQLTFMPYYTFLTATTDPVRRAAALASLDRTWAASRSGRSDLWAAIYMALTESHRDDDVASMLWTLRTWPIELINWNTSNTQRIDLQYQRDGARFLKLQGKRNTFTTKVIPPNERSQYIWNADPFDVESVQSWNNEPARRHAGMDEEDPGAWLLPYWLARYHNLIAAPASASTDSS